MICPGAGNTLTGVQPTTARATTGQSSQDGAVVTASFSISISSAAKGGFFGNAGESYLPTGATIKKPAAVHVYRTDGEANVVID